MKMQNDTTCIIVDDEIKTGKLFSDMLLQLYPDMTQLGVYNTWDAALAGIKVGNPHILFLDISMPEKTGFELLELMPDLKSEIIFVTAHSEFAIDAFEYDVCDYIVKPVSHKKIFKSVTRAIKRLGDKGVLINEPVQSLHNSKIGVPDLSGVKYIDVNDIVYLESVNGCTKVVMKDGVLTSSYHLSRFHEALDKRNFVQVHRSYIVNINHVTRYDSSGMIVMDTDSCIPVSRNHKEEFLNLIGRITK